MQSISNRDYPVIMGTTIFLAAFVVCMALIVDIVYKIVDPRINLPGGMLRWRKILRPWRVCGRLL